MNRSKSAAGPSRVVRALLALLAFAGTAAAQSPPQIPLVSGLTIVSALHYPEGDGENIVRVSDASSAGARYTWSFDHHGATSGSSLPDKGEFRRFVRASDLADAPRLDQVFLSSGPEESPGFTAFSISRAVYQRVLTEKQTPFTVTSIEGAGSLGATLGLAGQHLPVAHHDARNTGARVATPGTDVGAREWPAREPADDALHRSFCVPGREGDDRLPKKDLWKKRIHASKPPGMNCA